MGIFSGFVKNHKSPQRILAEKCADDIFREYVATPGLGALPYNGHKPTLVQEIYLRQFGMTRAEFREMLESQGWSDLSHLDGAAP